jgi:hypothetical protein
MNENALWMETRSRWLIRLLLLMAAIDFVGIVFGFLEYSLLSQIKSGTFAGDLERAADSNDLRQRVIGIVQIGLWLIAVVFSLVWIRRANRNAREAGAPDMKFTPNWSIGWYFIPFFNLWKPYQAMVEVWHASGRDDSIRPQVFPLWWGAWLFSSFTVILGRRYMNATTLDDLMNLSAVLIANDAATLVLNPVFASVVAKIRDRQLALARGGGPVAPGHGQG